MERTKNNLSLRKTEKKEFHAGTVNFSYTLTILPLKTNQEAVSWFNENKTRT